MALISRSAIVCPPDTVLLGMPCNTGHSSAKCFGCLFHICTNELDT